MTANPLTTGDFRDCRDACGATLIYARNSLVAGLNIVGPRGFAKAKANSDGAKTD